MKRFSKSRSLRGYMKGGTIFYGRYMKEVPILSKTVYRICSNKRPRRLLKISAKKGEGGALIGRKALNRVGRLLSFSL